MPFFCMTHEQNFVSVFPVSNSYRTKWGKKKKAACIYLVRTTQQDKD